MTPNSSFIVIAFVVVISLSNGVVHGAEVASCSTKTRCTACVESNGYEFNEIYCDMDRGTPGFYGNTRMGACWETPGDYVATFVQPAEADGRGLCIPYNGRHRCIALSDHGYYECGYEKYDSSKKTCNACALECVAGALDCHCDEWQCAGGLECDRLRNVCVDPSAGGPTCKPGTLDCACKVSSEEAFCLGNELVCGADSLCHLGEGQTAPPTPVKPDIGDLTVFEECLVSKSDNQPRGDPILGRWCAEGDVCCPAPLVQDPFEADKADNCEKSSCDFGIFRKETKSNENTGSALVYALQSLATVVAVATCLI